MEEGLSTFGCSILYYSVDARYHVKHRAKVEALMASDWATLAIEVVSSQLQVCLLGMEAAKGQWVFSWLYLCKDSTHVGRLHSTSSFLLFRFVSTSF
jgi:hypothetical protein